MTTTKVWRHVDDPSHMLFAFCDDDSDEAVWYVLEPGCVTLRVTAMAGPEPGVWVELEPAPNALPDPVRRNCPCGRQAVRIVDGKWEPHKVPGNTSTCAFSGTRRAV